MKMYLTAADVLSLDWKKNPVPLRDRAGVYRIHDRASGELLYVGHSSNLGARLSPSVHPVYRRDKHDVYILFVDDLKERGYMEGRFITLLKPPVNIRAGWRPKMDDALESSYYDLIFN